MYKCNWPVRITRRTYCVSISISLLRYDDGDRRPGTIFHPYLTVATTAERTDRWPWSYHTTTRTDAARSRLSVIGGGGGGSTVIHPAAAILVVSGGHGGRGSIYIYRDVVVDDGRGSARGVAPRVWPTVASDFFLFHSFRRWRGVDGRWAGGGVSKGYEKKTLPTVGWVSLA